MSEFQPFDAKPPRRVWTAHGLQCALMDAPFAGAINGYVRFPGAETWPLMRVNRISVHGGVTYGPSGDGWIGFDTVHSGDVWPESPAYMRDAGFERHWTEAAVIETTEALALSVIEAAAHRFTLADLLHETGLTTADLAFEATS